MDNNITITNLSYYRCKLKVMHVINKYNFGWTYQMDIYNGIIMVDVFKTEIFAN